MIPRDYITELVQRSDIVDVVQSYVQLRHRGRTHTGLCPFHNEKTPSFVVYPETQSFYCFGCGAGGDVITFIKKINNVDYIEAVKFLAGRAGMALPEEDDQTGRLRSRIISINKDAAVYPVRGQSGCDFHASGWLYHGGGRLRHGADSGAGEDIVRICG